MSLLRLLNVSAFYGPSQALFDVELRVNPGQVVALLGRNGMGKSTTIKVICRMLKQRGGSVVFDEQDISHWPSHKAARAGLGLVPEGRHFRHGFAHGGRGVADAQRAPRRCAGQTAAQGREPGRIVGGERRGKR